MSVYIAGAQCSVLNVSFFSVDWLDGRGPKYTALRFLLLSVLPAPDIGSYLGLLTLNGGDSSTRFDFTDDNYWFDEDVCSCPLADLGFTRSSFFGSG